MAQLDESQLALLGRGRRAVLGTIAPSGRPRLLPVAYAWEVRADEFVVYTPIDEKPKSVGDPHRLARVRDILARPSVTLLVDDWQEDWSRLAWLRLEGSASVLEPEGGAAAEHAAAVRLLRDRYPQYATQQLELRPVIRVRVERLVGWSAAG